MASKAKIAITNAFLELADEHDFEKITVTSLVEKCSISRQTFYYHFDDIDEMLKWAFKHETEKICNKQVEGEWKESAGLYIDFLNRYDKLLRSAAKSSNFIYVFGLLSESFSSYIHSYIEKKTKKPSASKSDLEFLVSCISNGFAGLVIEELKKNKSDYASLLEKITKGLILITSNK